MTRPPVNTKRQTHTAGAASMVAISQAYNNVLIALSASILTVTGFGFRAI